MALTKVDDRGLNTPIDLQDNEKIRLGTGNDLELFHNGTFSSIKDSTKIAISSPEVQITDAAVQTVGAKFVEDAQVELYYNGSEKLETTSSGVTVSGQLTAGMSGGQNPQGTSWATNSAINLYGSYGGGIAFNDNGNNGFVQYVESSGTVFNLKTGAVGGSLEQVIRAVKDGTVELYHNNTKKFETKSDGVSVYGSIFLPNDNTSLRIGQHEDLQMWHNNTDGYLAAYTGDLNFLINGNEKAIVAKPNGAVELYHDNTKRVETTGDSIKINGNLRFSSGANRHIYLGPTANADIYHTGSNCFINNSSGSLFINGNGVNNTFIRAKIGEDSIVASPNGAVELFHDNSKKIETTSTGATVTGTLTATTFSGDGIIPAGGIIIWSGASNAIPTGWLICDGTNSTPDLRDRFIIGAGNTYSVNATGGSADATLVSHSHTTNTTINPGNTGSKDLQGAISAVSETFGTGSGTATGVFTKTGNVSGQHTPASVDTSGSGAFSFDGRHRHGTDTQGSSATNANLPPYYALCYIMKS